MVAAGNGVDELVMLAVLAYVGRGGMVVCTATTYPGYAWAAGSIGARCSTVELDGFRVSATAIAESITPETQLVFICNPHNPTGAILAPGELDTIIDTAEAVNAVVVVDEAYIDFVDADESALGKVRAGRRLMVFRTFSKAWSLAAVRAGYAVGPTDLIDRLRQTRRSLPFSVNRLAQRAVPIALLQHGFIETVRFRTARTRELTCLKLQQAALHFLPSVTNFVMVSTAPQDSSIVTAILERKYGILVRDLAAFGLRGWIRITIGTPPEMEYCCTALTKTLGLDQP